MTVITRAPHALRPGRVEETPWQIELTGDIDLASQAHLDHLVRRMTAHPARDVTVDLSRVSFMGCIGLAFLIELREHVCHAGRRVTLNAPRPIVLRALRVSDSERLFTITGLPPAAAPADAAGGAAPRTTA